MTAIKSSTDSGFSCTSTWRIPEDSNWKTPFACPLDIISKVCGSDREIFSMEKSGWWRRIIFSASAMTVRLRSPKKSIFKSPSSSRVVMVYWVTIASSFLASGTYFSTESRAITTPAAWVEAWRGIPSIFKAWSISSLTCGSLSYMMRRSGERSSAFSMVICSSIGMAFATLSTF